MKGANIVFLLLVLAVSKEYIYLNEETLVIGSFLTFLFLFFTRVAPLIADAIDASIAETKSALSLFLSEKEAVLLNSVERLRAEGRMVAAAVPLLASVILLLWGRAYQSPSYAERRIYAVTRFVLANDSLAAQVHSDAEISTGLDVHAVVELSQVQAPALSVSCSVPALLSPLDLAVGSSEDDYALVSLNALALAYAL